MSLLFKGKVLYSDRNSTLNRMILDRGCSLDVADVEGDTVLHLAARRENNELLAALLRKGANPDIKNAVHFHLLSE